MKGIGLTKKFKDVTINDELLELKDSQNNHYYLATNPSVSEIIKVEFKTINI